MEVEKVWYTFLAALKGNDTIIKNYSVYLL